jgi:DNA polymerase I
MELFNPYHYLLIDCHNLAIRHWWPLRELRADDGTHSGLEYGFLSGLRSLVRRWQPARPVLIWDGRSRRCLDLFPVVTQDDGVRVGYKSKRENMAARYKEPDWSVRFAALRESLKSLIPTLYHPECEADEQIARWVFKAEAHGHFNLICSRDEDLKQLVSEMTHLNSFKYDFQKSEVIATVESVRSEYGISPHKLALWNSLTGDVSDAIPGVPRLYRKTIAHLLSQVDDINQLIQLIKDGNYTASENQKSRLRENQEIILRNYRLMELQSQRQFLPNLICYPSGDRGPLLSLCDRLSIKTLCHSEEWVWLQGLDWQLSPGNGKGVGREATHSAGGPVDS